VDYETLQEGCPTAEREAAKRYGFDWRMKYAMALIYARDRQSAHVAVADVCDEFLDQSGALLGEIRDLAAKIKEDLTSSAAECGQPQSQPDRAHAGVERAK